MDYMCQIAQQSCSRIFMGYIISKRIYLLPDRSNSIAGLSTVVHELIHIAQRNISMCRGEREEEAYSLQIKWAREQGIKGNFADVLYQLGISIEAWRWSTKLGCD